MFLIPKTSADAVQHLEQALRRELNDAEKKLVSYGFFAGVNAGLVDQLMTDRKEVK